MSWKSDIAKSISKIDKTSGITNEKVDILIDDFKDHKEREYGWQDRIERKVEECPEASHIKKQNGKLERLNEKLDDMDKRYFKYLLAAIGFICTVVGFIANWKEIFGG